MRKFVIKNRTKRKYTKKSEQQLSLSFIKTLYGMLPLLVMMVALMTTMVITSPLRDPQASLRFTFDLPTISLQNPLIFFQTLANFLGEGFLAFVSGFATLIDSIIHITQSGINSVFQLITLLDPRPMISLLGSGFMFFVLGVSSFFTHIMHAFGTLFSILGYYIQLAGESIISGLTIITHDIVTAVIVVARSIVTTAIIIAHLISVLGQIIITWIWSVMVAFSTFINHLVDAIVRGIEWPFKVIGAFLYRFKPTADVLGKHIAMAGSDLSGCFSNFGKTINYLSSVK